MGRCHTQSIYLLWHKRALTNLIKRYTYKIHSYQSLFLFIFFGKKAYLFFYFVDSENISVIQICYKIFVLFIEIIMFLIVCIYLGIYSYGIYFCFKDFLVGRHYELKYHVSTVMSFLSFELVYDSL